MKILVRIALLAFLAGAGLWLWTIFFPSAEKQVLKRVSNLAAAASMAPNAGNLVRAGKVSGLIAYFSVDAQVVVDVPGFGQGTLNGRDEIRQAAAGGYARMKSLQVQFLDPVVSVAQDGQKAVVNCTAKVCEDNSREFGIQELRFDFQRIDGDWRITRVETVKTLQ